LCHSRDQAEQVKARLAVWLAPRGLTFNEEKTRIVSLDDEGFDFLGFNVRSHSGKLLIKPSTAAMRRIRKRLSTEWRSLRGHNAVSVLAQLNPIIRGWSAYYRVGVSSKAFNALDAHMWRLAYKWAKRSHANKPRGWIIQRYFGTFNRSRNDHWVFGDRASGAYLQKFSWTRIVRHQLVEGAASVDDPALGQYWTDRRRRRSPPLDRGMLHLIQRQRGRCPLCGDPLLYTDREPQAPSEWAQWITPTRTALAKRSLTARTPDGAQDRFQLVHRVCERRPAGIRGPTS